MGSYISTSKLVELPFGSEVLNPFGNVLNFAEDSTKNEIIKKIINSNCDRIQTENKPTSNELEIVNEIFKLRPDITFRHYGSHGKEYVDISYLSKLTFLKKLSLNVYPSILNIETLEKMDLDMLNISCFGVREYGFLKGITSSLKELSINLEDKTYKMDIKDILHMKNLENLEIRNINKGIEKLSELKSLKRLLLRSIPVKDYSFLAKMNVKKLSLCFQNSEYFNTFGVNEQIEEITLWRNQRLTNLSFLLQFPNLKKIVITDQSKIETIPDLKVLSKLEKIYYLYGNVEKIKANVGSKVNIYSDYNPHDIS